MITIESDKKSDGIEIFLDREGVDELIDYLQFIKNENETFHLTVGNELSEEPIKGGYCVKHVKLYFI